jgi:peptidyl-prolyl cis-trans isomerase D
MALIGKIQKNSVLLLIVIGGAMLAFIFTDNFKPDNTQEIVPNGTVYGESFDEEEYETLKDVYVNRGMNEAVQQSQGQPLTADKQDQVRLSGEDQAFNETVRRNLMNREFERTGITCTSDELNDMIHGNHVHPWVKDIPIFLDMNGEFSKDSVRNFLIELDDEPLDEQAAVQWAEAKTQWTEFERELKDTRKADKYVALIKKGLFVNSLEAEHQYQGGNEIRNIRFVMQRYSDLAIDDFEVTDEDIKAYYEEHKTEAQYEMVESRDVEFVTIPILPSQSDFDSLASKMGRLKSQFEKTNDNLGFMNVHSNNIAASDSIEYGVGDATLNLPANQFVPTGTYPLIADEAVQASQIGDVIGPFQTQTGAGAGQAPQDVMFLGKITDSRTENQAWVRHILVKIDATRTEEEAQIISDDIIAEIEAKDNFVEMVTEHSEDPGSIANGGEYKWFPEDRMVTEFNDASFNGEIGKIQLVKTTFGFHIIEVLGRAERVVPKMAIVTKVVKASEETMKYTEEQVFDYIFRINDFEGDSAFYRVAEDSSYTVLNSRVWIGQSYITGIEKYKRIMKFAFSSNALEGDISDPIIDGDQYVVAYLNSVIEEGEPKFEDVKEQMRFSALKDVQARKYMAEMAGKSSLAEVAQAVTNGSILNAQITYGANVIAGGGGNEPDVIGALFRAELTAGAMTVPIKGRTGIYVAILDEITVAPETDDLSAEKDFLRQARQNASDNLVIRALREKAEVEDNRRKREYQ